jgi:hypothetical protein
VAALTPLSVEPPARTGRITSRINHGLAHFGSFVVLLGQDRADQADQGVAGGEDAHDVGAAAALAVQALLGLLDQIWRQMALGKAVKAKMSSRAASRCAAPPRFQGVSKNPGSATSLKTNRQTGKEDHLSPGGAAWPGSPVPADRP